MLIDITGIEITPGNLGIDCLGNGLHKNNDGEIIECCCDECDYLLCCTESNILSQCHTCTEQNCPRKDFAKK